MREIKFRGKCEEFDKWVYGDLSRDKYTKEYAILVNRDGFFVEKESIGQFTGLLDKFGSPIYEGDIVKIKSGEEATVVFGTVRFVTEGTSNTSTQTGWYVELENGCMYALDEKKLYCQIVGNTFDKKQL